MSRRRENFDEKSIDISVFNNFSILFFCPFARRWFFRVFYLVQRKCRRDINRTNFILCKRLKVQSKIDSTTPTNDSPFGNNFIAILRFSHRDFFVLFHFHVFFRCRWDFPSLRFPSTTFSCFREKYVIALIVRLRTCLNVISMELWAHRQKLCSAQRDCTRNVENHEKSNRINSK